MQDGKATGMAILGLMLGLLPCGLSYGAFAMALQAESVTEGMLLTGAFGLGTLPGTFTARHGNRRNHAPIPAPVRYLVGSAHVGNGPDIIIPRRQIDPLRICG